MGFSSDEITAATFNHLTVGDKLQGVFDAKSSVTGRYIAAKELLTACKNVASPFHGIIREELSKGKWLSAGHQTR